MGSHGYRERLTKAVYLAMHTIHAALVWRKSGTSHGGTREKGEERGEKKEERAERRKGLERRVKVKYIK